MFEALNSDQVPLATSTVPPTSKAPQLHLLLILYISHRSYPRWQSAHEIYPKQGGEAALGRERGATKEQGFAAWEAQAVVATFAPQQPASGEIVLPDTRHHRVLHNEVINREVPK